MCEDQRSVRFNLFQEGCTVNTFRKAIGVGLVVAFSTVLQAGGVDTSLRNAEARRTGAENRARGLKKKSTDQTNDVRAAYTDAATSQKAWLDLVTQALQQGGSAPPDVAAAAERAGTSLIIWVGVSSRAEANRVDVPDAAKTAAVQDLITISTESWNANHQADERKRAVAVSDLKNRLKWKTWDEIQ